MVKVSPGMLGRDLFTWGKCAAAGFKPVVSVKSLRVHGFDALSLWFAAK